MIISSFVIYGIPDREAAQVFDEYMANCARAFGEENNLELTFASTLKVRDEVIEFEPDEDFREQLEGQIDESWDEFINNFYGE